jgi:beta-lactamase regulating signal transducer with metallopeptidase domain
MRLDGTYFEQLWVRMAGLPGLDLLWGSALAAVPLALGVWLVCRFGRIRPATRHMLWVVVLVSLVTPMIGGLIGLPRLPIEAWLSTDEESIENAERLAGNSIDAEHEPPAGLNRTSPPSPINASSESPPSIARSGDQNAWAQRPDQLDERALDRLRWAMGLDQSTADLETTNTFDRFRAWTMSPIDDMGTVFHTDPTGDLAGFGTGVENLTPPMTASSQVSDRVPEESTATITAKEAVTEADAPEPITTAPSTAHRLASRAGGAIREELGRWGAAFVSLRDAAGKIPPIPAGVWLAGIAAVLTWRMIRVMCFRRALRTGTPAPARVEAQVRNIAEEIGLARIPRTVMLDRRTSPFVWCGLRPTLVLPVGLWGELDREGQRAVLMHELAHLRRRDHLVLWLSQAVSLVYWWHPVVWWARQRIDEEADFACDAWVTALRPSGRRVYAETLVVAKSYVSGPGLCRVGGLPMASRSARQLSRRLTMVMTQRKSPGLSALGVVLAAGVAGAGVFVTPSLACPEDDAKATPQPEAPPIVGLISGVPAAPTAFPAPDAVSAPAYPTGLVSVVPAAPTSFDLFQPGLVADDPELIELLKRIEKLEKALQELRQEARTKASSVRGRVYRDETDVAKDRARASNAHAEDLRREAKRRVQLDRELAAEAENAKRRNKKAQAEVKKSYVRAERLAEEQAAEAVQARELYEHLAAEKARNRGSVAKRARDPYEAMEVPTPLEPAPPSRAARPSLPGRHASQIAPTSAAGDEVQVSYTLSPGKLKALTELMARQDVPIVIARGEDSITVIGTRSQQKIFAAFVKMIDPGTKAQRLRAPQRAAPTRTQSGRHSAIEADNAAVKEAYSKYAQGYAAAVDAEKALKADQVKLKAYNEMLKAQEMRLRDEQNVLATKVESLRRNAERLKARAPEKNARNKKEQDVWAQEKKVYALAKELESRAAVKVKGPSKREVDVLHKRIAELEAKAAEMAAQAEHLKRKIKELSAPRDE